MYSYHLLSDPVLFSSSYPMFILYLCIISAEEFVIAVVVQEKPLDDAIVDESQHLISAVSFYSFILDSFCWTSAKGTLSDIYDSPSSIE
jgi:hypothetical protein